LRPKPSRNPPEADLIDISDDKDPVSGKGTSWGFVLQDLISKRSQEPDFSFLLYWLKDGTEPEKGELFRSSGL
jgi:hypothetical protein